MLRGIAAQGVTVNVSGQGVKQLHFADGQVGSGQLLLDQFYLIRYDGTNFVIVGESLYGTLPPERGGTGTTSIADLLTALGIGDRLIPSGGASGQVLSKASGSNYDTDWETVTQGAGGLSTLIEGDHVEITGTGNSRTIAVETGGTSGLLAELGSGGRFPSGRVPRISRSGRYAADCRHRRHPGARQGRHERDDGGRRAHGTGTRLGGA